MEERNYIAIAAPPVPENLPESADDVSEAIPIDSDTLAGIDVKLDAVLALVSAMEARL